jgi:hypothetical protein
MESTTGNICVYETLFKNEILFFCFHSRTVNLHIIKVSYLLTDAQENCFKMNIKIYINI